MRKWWIGTLLLLPLCAGTAGCKLIAFPFLMWGKPQTKTIKAEYPYLVDKSVAVVVRAELDTLVEYPEVQHDISDHVAMALKANIAGVTVAPPKKVVAWQGSEPDWDRMDPALVGKRFDADRLLEIQLTQYTTREPESPFLHRGYISAVLNVYNTDYPDSAPAWSSDVRTVYPPDGAGQWGSSDREIRKATLEAFAEEVSGKFYDRKVKVE